MGSQIIFHFIPYTGVPTIFQFLLNQVHYIDCNAIVYLLIQIMGMSSLYLNKCSKQANPHVFFQAQNSILTPQIQSPFQGMFHILWPYINLLYPKVPHDYFFKHKYPGFFQTFIIFIGPQQFNDSTLLFNPKFKSSEYF